MNLWLPGAERIKGPHSAGGVQIGGNALCTHHITVSAEGSYNAIKPYLVKMGYEPTLLLDPTTGQRGQYLPAGRSAFALEHPSGQPETNREGRVHIQIEWVWPDMRQDITKAPHFAAIWADLIPWLEQLGVPSVWTFGLHSSSRDRGRWRQGGHRGHVNAPGNTHVDNLPTVREPAWVSGLTPAQRRRLTIRLRHAVHRVRRLRHRLGRKP